MFRQPLLPRACLTIALGVAVLVAPARSWSQDRSTEERLDRLERDLNMLQRQVYRGVPPAAMAPDSGAAVGIEIRMDRLEQQMRELTGRVEETMNRLDQLRRRVEQIDSDVGMRLGQAAGGPPPAPAAPGASPADVARPPPAAPPFPPPAPAYDEPTPPRAADLRPPGPPPAGPGGPTPIFGTLTPPGLAQRAPQLASVPPAAPPAAAEAPPGGSPTEQYKSAFALLKKADYPAAAAAFKAFVERHPKDRLAGSAQYWLGETYYTRGKYMEAASAFAEGYKRWPNSAKAADDLLKLGMSLGRANQKQNACLALAQLDRDFPHAGAAVRARAGAEKQRLGC